ncbi:hypothetical protein ACHHYP_05867 [Achlya hypogyna]|uniref:Uncharacterized protein n=1 Tax=Achlya hypogyna TaxID=1202772 RepID=A0A1V9YWF6_ACHHY|nr:hypothetical protein ACHHYP_05867 [Achlya hypogyna]
MSSPLEEVSDSESVAVLSAEDVKKERKARFVYKESHDIDLLREILGDDGLFVGGLKEIDKWRGVHERLVKGGMTVSVHSLRQQLRTMYDAFLAADAKSKRASGAEESLDEKTKLHTEYHELKLEQDAAKEVKKQTKDDTGKKNDEGGRAIRDAALKIVERKIKDDKPAASKSGESSKFDVYAFLKENQRLRAEELQERAAHKRQRLQFEERQLMLQEKAMQQQAATFKLMASVLEKLAK